MMQPTETQKTILKAAARRPNGNIEPLPQHIHAGIRPRVIQGLLNRQWIDAVAGSYAISQAGRSAIGARTTPSVSTAVREGTKQAQLIALLRRPEGASIDDLVAETGWQPHSVRGALSHTLKKRLGLKLTSQREEGQARRYHIQES